MTAPAALGQPPRLDELVRDIEAAIAGGDRAVQSDLVLRSADALTRRWSRLHPADKPTFDRLLAGLLGQVDETARAAFAVRLTPLRRAPRQTATLLARDPSIRVAGPLLEGCPSFDDAWLLDIVAACCGAHLRAVARRQSLDGAVADALIRLGGPEVAAAVLANPGAALPTDALPRLMRLARESEAVAVALGGRADLPAAGRAALADLARERARASLAQGGAFDPPAVEALLSGLARTFATPIAPDRAARFAGSAAVADAAFGAGPAAPARIERWIAARRIEDVLAAMTRDAGLPVAVAVACHDAGEPAALTILSRGLDHPWSTLKALLRARHGGSPEPDTLSDAYQLHGALSPLAARRLARYAAARLNRNAFARFTADGSNNDDHVAGRKG